VPPKAQAAKVDRDRQSELFLDYPSSWAGMDDRRSVPLRRRFPRVFGPFAGRYLGANPRPVWIHDLSVGGCLVELPPPISVGRRLQLAIDLPNEGSVTVLAEVLYLREGFGFSARFVDVSDETQRRLDRSIKRLLNDRQQQMPETKAP
jgi:hypothetical protein